MPRSETKPGARGHKPGARGHGAAAVGFVFAAGAAAAVFFWMYRLHITQMFLILPVQDVEVTCDPPCVKLSGEVRDAVLACHMKRGTNSSDPNWSIKLLRGKQVVHYVSNGFSDLTEQDPQFRDRTEFQSTDLDDNSRTEGNFTFKIFHVSTRDEGNYTLVTVWNGPAFKNRFNVSVPRTCKGSTASASTVVLMLLLATLGVF